MQAGSSAVASRKKPDGQGRSSARLSERSLAYGAAIAAVALAVGARYTVSPAFGDIAPLLPFVPAVLIGAWLGGLGPGLVATSLGSIAGTYFFLEPHFFLADIEPHEVARLVLFVTSGALISVLIEQMHRARRRAEVSEARLAAILSQLPVGVGLLDREGRFVLTNRLMERFSLERMPSSDPHGVRQWKAYDEHGRPLDPSQWPGARALRGEPVSPGIECQYTDAAGERLWSSVAAVPMRNERGVVDGAVVVIQDIDRIKRAAESLAEADRRKDAFLATLAHELRNPLAPIKNAVEILKLRGPGDPVLDNCRNVIDRQLEHMVRLVDDLLDVSRITRNRLELRLQPVALQAVVEQALEIVRPQVERSRQRLVISVPDEVVLVLADPMRLAQVLTNVLSNASKYSVAGTEIRLTATQHAGQAVVTVADQGIGIEPDQVARLFEMFAQVSSSLQHAQGGLGIGLWLSRQLMEMQGGTIEVASDGPGTGSRFTLKLPVHAAAATPRQPPAAAERAVGTSLRILVVDDNEDGAATLAELLRVNGNAVEIAGDGIAAIEIADRFAPDLVLLDIGLPGLNGYEVCRRIRQRPWGHRLPIVGMTGWGQDEDRRRSAEAGFDTHLVKPIDYATLLQAMKQAMASRSQG